MKKQILYYLIRDGPLFFHVAMSSQGMQDHLGAKSTNWLASWLCLLSTSFPISPSQAMKDPLKENEGGNLPSRADKMEKDCNWFAFYLFESMK